jgi:hypothetical protein
MAASGSNRLRPGLASDAEYPLSCSGIFAINKGCPPPTDEGTLYAEEGRNENGGAVAIQYHAGCCGYSEVLEAFNGNVASYYIGRTEFAYPKVWNRTNANNLIHGRALK